jgi:RimJ/RimL family protein N-acetyltransferase
MPTNLFGQIIGEPVDDFLGDKPSIDLLEGVYCQVEKLDVAKHFEDLFDFFGDGPNAVPEDWTYLSLEGNMSREELSTLLREWEVSEDPYYLVIKDKVSQRALGIFSLMRINQSARSIEMGWVIYSCLLQKSRIATEAQYLVMKYVFEVLNYRRYEWKCDHLNTRSHNAALRLGFTFEGTFRQATIYKGRTRDTDWHSILDKEWSANKFALESWLSADNFTEEGRQLKSLSDFR